MVTDLFIYFIKIFSKQKKIYIFEREHDVLVDPLRYRVKLNFIIKFIINFFPKPDILFMNPNIKTIWSRKREIKYDINQINLL